MNELEDLRKQIDALDHQILLLLARRIKIAQKTGEFKKKQNLPFLDAERWKKVLKTNLLRSGTFNLPAGFVKKLFTLIHEYSLEAQKGE